MFNPKLSGIVSYPKDFLFECSEYRRMCPCMVVLKYYSRTMVYTHLSAQHQRLYFEILASGTPVITQKQPENLENKSKRWENGRWGGYPQTATKWFEFCIWYNMHNIIQILKLLFYSSYHHKFFLFPFSSASSSWSH